MPACWQHFDALLAGTHSAGFGRQRGDTMLRILIVDDSPTARELIAAILRTDPDMEVVGEAADGVEAVELAAQLKPHVITMDIHMPRMNGCEATKRIMADTPTPIVVVTTASQEELIHQGLNILLEGALDIVQKPSALTERDYEAIGDELVAKVKAVSQVSLLRQSAAG
jgi:two-component system, chemotaxis family, protein-glutamate methylesterase/glutaminase